MIAMNGFFLGCIIVLFVISLLCGKGPGSGDFHDH